MKSLDSMDSKVADHYARQDLGAEILSALVKAGKDPNNLRPGDLAPVDEFHIRGREATLELANFLDLNPRKLVLDVGSGIGGPSRCLAAEFGCRVIGLDLSEEYCRVAGMLAKLVGLGGTVEYRHGNALHLPFEDAGFDAVWTQHAAMNIADKPRLYSEMKRVLKPDGLLAIYDVLAGPAGPPHFPVPWARDPSINFLATPEELRRLLETTGFEILHWRETTDAGREWFRQVSRRIKEQGPPPLGFHLLLGPEFAIMAENQRRNLDEGRITLIETVARQA